jgi:hypothetical protein
MANLAGAYLEPFSFLNSPEYKSLPDSDQQFVREYNLNQSKFSNPTEAPFNKALGTLLEQSAYNQTPEGRQKLLEQQLAYDKTRGDQQMKYRMTNDIISNLGKAAYSAFGGGRLPYDYVAQGIGNVGNAYLAGRQAIGIPAPLVGQRYF